MASKLNLQKYHADSFSVPLFLPSSLGLMPGDGINSIIETLVEPLGTSQAEEPLFFLQVVLQICRNNDASRPEPQKVFWGKIQHRGARAWGLLHAR